MWIFATITNKKKKEFQCCDSDGESPENWWVPLNQNIY